MPVYLIDLIVNSQAKMMISLLYTGPREQVEQA